MNTNGTLILAGCVALSLAGCGARSDETAGNGNGQPQYNAAGELISGGDPSLGAAVPAALEVRVLSDVSRIKTGGSDAAVITALITDMDNNAVAEQAVKFSADGGVLQDRVELTDENGQAGATLKLADDFRTQDIVVTVSAGPFEGQVLISVDGSELDVSGPPNLVEGASAELVVALTDGDGDPIANQSVTLESSAGNTVVPAVAVTDADGRVSATVTSFNGDDTIRVSALEGTVTATHAFTVSSDSLGFALADEPVFAVGSVNDIVVTWTSQGQPVVGRDLRVSSTAGQLLSPATVTTNAAGQATITLTSSSAGTARVSVEDAVDGDPATYADVDFIATTPATVAIEAGSTRVPTLGTSTITALVTDLNGNPVRGREVVFSSANLRGGQLDPAYATSGEDGRASITFTAGAEATEVDEIALGAQVEGTAISDVANLTVVERVLNVTIGTSNKIKAVNLGTQYEQPFVVQVADGGGAPLAGAPVTLSVRPLGYGKGELVTVDSNGFAFNEVGPDENWTAAGWAYKDFATEGCASEDLDSGNRVLDAGEDINNNGSLDPQDPATLAAVEGDGLATLSGDTVVTDANGSGYFRMLYPVSTAWWAEVEITARARDLGAEAEDSFSLVLSVAGEEIGDPRTWPANHTSPYGTELDCTVDR